MLWISVKDELPVNYGGVIVYDASVISIAEYVKAEKWEGWAPWTFGGYEYEWDLDVGKITHWMRLPEPPLDFE